MVFCIQFYLNFNICMKKLLLLLTLSFFSIQASAGSCSNGSDPVKSISTDGTYFEYKCAGAKKDNKTLKSSSNKKSTGINTYGGSGYISERESPNFETLRWSLYRKLHYRPLQGDRYYSVKASNPSNFQFDLRKDKYIKTQMQTTPLISYLLYEDGKIVIDEITPKDRFGDMFTDSSMFHSMSMGKSITSYIVGHAICDGKIKSIDSRLDWPILEDTLYHNQKLINLLNMSSGDQAHSQNDESSLSIQSRMASEFKGSKKTKAQYNYTNLNTNLVLSYLLYTYGDAGFKKLLDDIFQKKVRIKNEVWLNKTADAKKYEESLGHQFFTTRYDFLRIAKAMLDDWQKDSCVGKYLKTVHERRISKNGAQGTRGRVGLPLSYAGFFHTDYKGMENRPVMGMDGNGGQTILIDFKRGRIVATNAVFDNMRFPEEGSFDFEKISYERIKNGKPTLSSVAKKSEEPIINPQKIILVLETRQEDDRKAKQYWDDYYDCALKISDTANLEACIEKIVQKREKENLTMSNFKKIVKAQSEENELLKTIKTSNTFDGYYSFTLVKSPMTELGSGSLEINNGMVTITQDSKGILTPSYDSFEGRIDQNGDIKAIFYFHPCSGCEDKLVIFDGNINKKKLSGKYNDIKINFYLTGKKAEVI